MLEVYLRELVAAAFELPASDIDPRLPLTSMGLESLMAVEVRNEIEADLGISISMVDFVEGPSIADLVTGLLRQITGEATGSRANGSGADAEWEEFRL